MAGLHLSATATPEPEESFPVAWSFLSFSPLSVGMTIPMYLHVQILQQLFELEECMGDTKNRTCTPLSQLPLHCLWDRLCFPLTSSFCLLAGLPPSLSGSFYPHLSIFFPTFLSLLNQALGVWPVLSWHERPDTGHHLSSLFPIIQPGGKLEHCGSGLKTSPVPRASDVIV